MFEGATCGTAVRVGSDLFVTAAHVVSDKGRLLSCTIDGVPIKLEFSVPRMDIAVIRGSTGPELQLMASIPRHSHVCLMAYPQAVDEGMHVQVNDTAPQYTVTEGEVARVDTAFSSALADYSAAMPNCSGGAVLRVTYSDVEVMGVHTDLLYHTDKSHEAADFMEPDLPDLGRVDINPEMMYDFSPSTPKPKGSMQQRALQLSTFSYDNVPHKGQMGLFTPADAILLRLALHNLKPAHGRNMGLSSSLNRTKRSRANLNTHLLQQAHLTPMRNDVYMGNTELHHVYIKQTLLQLRHYLAYLCHARTHDPS